MDKLYFVTSNKGKFEQVKQILGLPVEQLNIDLPESQSLDAGEILRHKMLAAEEYAKGNYIVEDTSVYFSCLNGKLPGPLIKWFEKAIGNEGLALLAYKLGDTKAEALTSIGYAEKSGEMHFFEGRLKGNIVDPRGEFGFGWSPIFQPESFKKTLAEMEVEEFNAVSMRNTPLRELKKFLESRG